MTKQFFLSIIIAYCTFQQLQAMNLGSTFKRYKQLETAVLNQDTTKVKQLLLDKVSPNDPFANNSSVLSQANSKQLAQLLIAHGAKIPENILTDGICQRDDYPAELLSFYLELGFKVVNFSATENTMELALHSLTKSSFPVGNPCAQELTPEQLNNLKNRLEKAQLLLKYDANPYQSTYRGDTAFHVAAEKEDLYMLRLLIENEIIRKPSFFTFLACCKRNFPQFYVQKDILKMFWNSLAPSHLLALKNREGKLVSDLGSDLFKSSLKNSITTPFNLEAVQ